MKKKIVFIFTLYISCALFGQESGCRYIVRGLVIDSSHTDPLALAEIEVVGLKGKQAATNAKGEFEIRDLCRGPLELHVSHQQCEHIHLSFILYNDTQITIFLKHIEQEFEAVKFSIKGEKQEKLNVLNARQLETKKGSSIAALMQEIGGVSLLKTGSNVSKPVVNGLHSNRVIIVNNGIRQEGQNWGMEHAPEIDAFLANEIELIRGAEFLRYAPDGIGGVVLIRPASIFREKTGRLTGEFNILGSSNGRTGTVSGFAGNKVSEKFPLYWRLQGTFKQSGNVHAPDYFIGNTGMKERNYSFNLGYKSRRFSTEVFRSHFENIIGIFSGSHIGNLNDLKKAMESDAPLITSGFTYKIKRPFQSVFHELFKLKNEYIINARDHIEFILAYQDNHRREYDILRSSSSFPGPAFDYRIRTYSGDLCWVRNDFHKLNFKAGLYGMHQFNNYTGRFFIPAFYQKGLASYFIASKNHRDIQYEASIRYDLKQLKSFLWHNNIPDIKVMNFSHVTYVLQAGEQLNKLSKLILSHSSTWRPPAPNELFSNGLHQGLASIEIGDSSLKPERSFNQSLIYVIEKKAFYLEAEAYYKYISGFINLVPSLTPQLTIRGAFPVFRYEQNNAEIYGLNFTLKRDFTKYFFARTSANILFGNNLTARLPLNQMPPQSGKTAIGYDNKKMAVQAFVQYTATQYRYTENSDYKAPPKGYYLLGLDASFKFRIRHQPLNFNLSITNLTNNRYREYLNRFRYFTDEQGFNLTARLIVPLVVQFNTIKHHEH